MVTPTGTHATQPLRGPAPAEAPLFSDGIGERVVSSDPATGELIQVLRINPALTAVPSFEFALRERVARLTNFRHPYFARIRRVDRAPSAHVPALSLVSDHVEGTRLSEILRVVEERGLHLDINAALCLVRQLVPAVALLHENARDAAHGLISPERLVITPNGRLIIVEHVFGAAVEQMQYGRERLWHQFNVAMPPSAGIPRFDQRADVTGIGVVSLSLVLGRRLRTDEFPRALSDLLNSARERSARGEEQPLSAELRSWLARALQIDMRRAFASASDALAPLEEATGDGSPYVPAPVALETFLSRYVSAVLTPAAPARSAPEEVTRAVQVVAPAPVEISNADAPPEPAPLDLPPLDDVEAPPQTLFDPDQPFSIPDGAAPPPPAPRRSKGKWALALGVLAVLASGGFVGFKTLAGGAAPAMATLSVDSNPSGVPIFVDGVDRGVTPARITLAPGAHILELRRGVPRVIPITLTAGADVSQYLEFAETPLVTEETAAPTAVQTPEPPAAAVAPVPVAGWIAAKMPFAVEIHEQGRLVGTTEAERLMLPAGPHQLEFVNELLGYRAQRTVNVIAGKVTTIALEIPMGSVNLNAAPWAEVWIDGQRVGETPIGNLAVAIGPREIVFKHPQLGEKRHAVSVTVGSPVRLSVDMK